MEKISKIKYLILGNGFIGNRMKSAFEDSVLSIDRINSMDDATRVIQSHDPEVIINCIGKTGFPNVDWCEDHKEETLESNVLVAGYILMACQKLDKFMVQLSTGCIYEGDNDGKGFREEDQANFFGSYYSRTKFIVEKMLKDFDVLQLRLRMPIDSIPHQRNILDKLLKYDKIISVDNSLTSIPDFLKIAKVLIDKRVRGIFNVVAKNPITHDEVLRIYNEATGNNKEFTVISIEEMEKDLVKARRSTCVLSTEKLERELEGTGVEVRDVKEVVKDCILEHAKNSGDPD